MSARPKFLISMPSIMCQFAKEHCGISSVGSTHLEAGRHIFRLEPLKHLLWKLGLHDV
jgi:hypothetical protein